MARATRLKTARNLSLVVFGYSDVDLAPRCIRKEFWTACLLLPLLLAILVLRNALEVTVEETLPVLEM